MTRTSNRDGLSEVAIAASADTGDAGDGSAPALTPTPPLPFAARWLRTLYEEQSAILLAYLKRKYGAGPPDPDDAVQQAFLQLSRLPEATLKEVTHPKSFLFRVAENALLGEKRRIRTRAQHANETIARFEPTSSFECDPESVLVTRQELDIIERTLRAMPERRRTAFIMHRMEDKNFVEIARTLGVSPTAARNHVEKALSLIEAALETQNGDRP